MEKGITLRPVVDSDLPIFFEQQNDPVANELAASAARNRDTFFWHWERIRVADSVLIRTVLYDNQVAGHILSFDMNGKREVGYWLGRNFWGKGIASNALKQFLDVELTRPVYGYAAKQNIGSQRVLQKCGFELLGEEGIYRVLVLK